MSKELYLQSVFEKTSGGILDGMLLLGPAIQVIREINSILFLKM